MVPFVYSLGLFVEEMDVKNDRLPLFEVLLQLEENDIVFTPSLQIDLDNPHCFYGIINNLLEDILHMGSIVPRVAKIRLSFTYKVR